MTGMATVTFSRSAATGESSLQRDLSQMENPPVEPSAWELTEQEQPDEKKENSPTGDVQIAPEEENPEILIAFLRSADIDLDTLEASQLIVVSSEKTDASLYAFEMDPGGAWRQVLGPEEGHVGKNGVTQEKAEGDKKTPAGLFLIPFAFGIQSNPGCALMYQQVTESSCWVDDPNSSFYNQWVEEIGEKDWDSAEHLIDYSEQYAYAMVVGYNMDPVIPRAGSAIFFHCGNRPTAGCISASEETVLKFMRWLTLGSQPKILII